MKAGQAAQKVDVDLSGVKTLILIVNSAGDGISYDHADWADAKIIYAGAKPFAIDAPVEEMVILTPKPGPAPKINGPRVYGVRPGNPFIYRIPCTGKRPITFEAQSLPTTLKLDKQTGIITGKNPDRGEYIVTLKAQNRHGKDSRTFKIVAGDTLALTPPMGWNHWYTHYNDITEELMRNAAKAMVDSGMADYGYQYVNIDDCWMNAPKHYDPKRVGPLRDENGNILCNSYFPDMKGLVDYIHSFGLKAGTYTSPGPYPCAGFSGSWQHEEQDAIQFAEWGFDFLKHDWCSYGRVEKDKTLVGMKRPYQKMGSILKGMPRDIVLNLCQYGMGDVWKWGEEVGGHCWRTAGDLGFELTNYHNVASRNSEFHSYARPGAWNDPDYLLLGMVGNAGKQREGAKPCPLTANEQYSYMSLWCLMASPLFFTGDMGKLDEFTLNVLCNAEVLDINQDPLGGQGYPVVKKEGWEIWKKPLEDGSIAVGLFNRNEFEHEVTLKWQDIGITGKHRLRDLWRQKDLGVYNDTFTCQVPRHGVIIIRLFSTM
jgi:alpha-galactosidase